MESDLQRHNHHPHLPQHHQKQMNSGLTRYQSAPSAYFSSFMDREFFEEFLNRPTSPETERIFARFLSGSGGNMDNPSDQKFGNFRQRSPVKQTSRQMEQQPQILTSTSKETGVMLRQQQLQQSSYSSASRSFYQSQSQQHLSRQNSGSAMDYRATSTMGMDQPPHLKMVGGSSTSSNLIRHSSSPAGFFSVLDGEDGYALLRGMGSFGGGNSTDRESSFASASRQHSCSSGLMSPITEIESQKANSSESGGLGYPIGCSWDDSAFMSDDISGSTGVRDDDRGLSKNIEAANRPPSGQKLRLPGKSPADISAIEKFFQDSVPCKIRAKRGFATHPRSIAERVRRTRISERMRKLQDLVPNMDKQTNTADMLDLAVEYIKDLQQQVKALSDNREKCTCPNKQEE